MRSLDDIIKEQVECSNMLKEAIGIKQLVEQEEIDIDRQIIILRGKINEAQQKKQDIKLSLSKARSNEKQLQLRLKELNNEYYNKKL